MVLNFNKSKKVIWILILLGFLASTYTTYLHYTPNDKNPKICDFNDKFSCSTVNTSTYSIFFGIPVALIGLAGYLFLFFLTLIKSNNKKAYLFYASLIGLTFSLYLTYAEFFILKAICLFCVVSQLTILGIVLITWCSCKKGCLKLELN